MVTITCVCWASSGVNLVVEAGGIYPDFAPRAVVLARASGGGDDEAIRSRFGETTYRLTNITFAEPSTALFEVPSGFTIVDRPAGLPGMRGPVR